MGRRRIPARAMPDLASIEPCTGRGARGALYGSPLPDPVRANFNARRPRMKAATLTVGDVQVEISGEVVLDDVELPLLSRVTNVATGDVLVVGALLRFDQPPVQPFVVAGLGQVVG